MNKKKKLSDILDELYERYEYTHKLNRQLKDVEVAKELGISKTIYSNIKHEKRALTIDDAIKLANYFEVPMEVIVGEMTISEIPPISTDGLIKLSFLSRKWIFDNSKYEEGEKRIKILNHILSNHSSADLLFDTLYAYTIGIPIRVRSLDENYSNSDIEKILYKELILSSLDKFFDDIYRRTESDREKRTEEQVNAILKRMQESKQALKQQHEKEDAITSQILKEEQESGLIEMIEDNATEH